MKETLTEIKKKKKKKINYLTHYINEISMHKVPFAIWIKPQ